MKIVMTDIEQISSCTRLARMQDYQSSRAVIFIHSDSVGSAWPYAGVVTCISQEQ